MKREKEKREKREKKTLLPREKRERNGVAGREEGVIVVAVAGAFGREEVAVIA